jgi:hypothetical protein
MFFLKHVLSFEKVGNRWLFSNFYNKIPGLELPSFNSWRNCSLGIAQWV